MTPQEILEYNKRCAEFLGFKYRNSKKSWGKYPLDNNSFLSLKGWLSMDKLQFHSDWNWIMGVVEAIEKIKEVRDVCITSTGCVIFHKEKPFSSHIEDKKEAVVQAINQFLIWYNENRNNR